MWTLPNEIAVLEGGQDATFTVSTAAPGTRETTSVAGTLTYDSALGDPSGPGVALLFDCADPPPPTGSGAPTALALVNSWDTGVGTFAFREVSAGACVIVSGFVDNDGDFDAFYDVTAGFTAGDVAIDPQTIVVGDADAAGVVDPITLSLTATTVIPLERPTFSFRDSLGDSEPTLEVGATPGSTVPVTITVDAQEMDNIFTASTAPI